MRATCMPAPSVSPKTIQTTRCSNSGKGVSKPLVRAVVISPFSPMAVRKRTDPAQEMVAQRKQNCQQIAAFASVALPKLSAHTKRVLIHEEGMNLQWLECQSRLEN